MFRKIIPAILGNILEYYDVMLYGFFASMLAPVFFPSESQFVCTIASLGAFAAGFISRPLGALLFGYIGDVYGRKTALLIAILLVTIPTFVISILPSYAIIGVFAPLILVTCRLLQGLCVGGEWTGAAIFVVEHSPKNKQGLASGIMCSTGYIGALLGICMATIFTFSIMPHWGWRIPFFIGFIFGIIVYFLRRKILETPQFVRIKKDRKIISLPLIEVFKKEKKGLFCTFGIGALGTIPFYLVSVYMSVVIANNFNFSTTKIMTINVVIMLLWIITIQTMGYISDIVGKTRLMLSCGIGILLLAYPLFELIKSNNSILHIYIFQFVLSILGASFIAPLPVYLSRLFPINARYTGVSLGLTLGQVFGGLAPLISSVLVHWLNDDSAPAFMLMFFAVLGILSIKWVSSVNYNIDCIVKKLA